MNIINTVVPSHVHVQRLAKKSCSFTAKYICSLYNKYTYMNSVNLHAWSYQVLWKHSGAVLVVCVVHTHAGYTHRISLWGSEQILQNKNITMYDTASNGKLFVNIKLYSEKTNPVTEYINQLSWISESQKMNNLLHVHDKPFTLSQCTGTKILTLEVKIH